MKDRLIELYLRVARRPVRHRRVWIALYGVIPMLWIVAMTIIGATVLGGEFGAVAGLGVPIINGCLLHGVFRDRLKYIDFHANNYDIEIIDHEDRGEALELGPGWRKVRFSLVETKGIGRLESHTMGWMDMAYSADNQQTIMLDVSDPEMRNFLVSVGRISK